MYIWLNSIHYGVFGGILGEINTSQRHPCGKLAVVKLGIKTVLCHQPIMGSAFHNFTVVKTRRSETIFRTIKNGLVKFKRNGK